MAKPRVQSSRKRLNRRKQELKAPDEVTTALQKLGDHLNKHIKVYMLGLGAVLVVALGLQMLWESRERAQIEGSKAAVAAFDAANGTVAAYAQDEKLVSLSGDAPETVESTYATDEERWKAALDEIASGKEGASSELVPLLSALEGRAQLALGKASEADAAFGAFVSESEESALLPIVIESRGRAAEASGDTAAAAGYYEQLAGLSDAYYKVRGSVLLGDLYNPSMSKAPDATRARSHYDAALQALVPGEGQVLTAPQRGLRSEIARRRASLDG